MPGKQYTESEKQYIIKYYRILTKEEIAEALGRTPFAIGKWARENGLRNKRYFTDWQKAYIDSHIGIVSYTDMARKFGVSYNAIKTYCSRYICKISESENGGYILAEISRLVGRNHKTVKSTWCDKRGLPYRHCGKHIMIKPDDLFEFMKNNTDLWTASDCEEWFFSDKKWFQRKKQQEFDRKVEERWGQWKENCQN